MLGTEDAFKRWKFKVIRLTYSRFKYAFAEKLLTWISKKEFVQPRIHPYAPNTIKLELIFWIKIHIRHLLHKLLSNKKMEEDKNADG